LCAVRKFVSQSGPGDGLWGGLGWGDNRGTFLPSGAQSRHAAFSRRTVQRQAIFALTGFFMRFGLSWARDNIRVTTVDTGTHATRLTFERKGSNSTTACRICLFLRPSYLLAIDLNDPDRQRGKSCKAFRLVSAIASLTFGARGRESACNALFFKSPATTP